MPKLALQYPLTSRILPFRLTEAGLHKEVTLHRQARAAARLASQVRSHPGTWQAGVRGLASPTVKPWARGTLGAVTAASLWLELLDILLGFSFPARLGLPGPCGVPPTWTGRRESRVPAAPGGLG